MRHLKKQDWPLRYHRLHFIHAFKIFQLNIQPAFPLFLGYDAQKLRREIPETDQVCVSTGLQLCLGKGESYVCAH